MNPSVLLHAATNINQQEESRSPFTNAQHANNANYLLFGMIGARNDAHGSLLSPKRGRLVGLILVIRRFTLSTISFPL